MDNIIYAALDEVCVRGPSGIRLLELWPCLQAAVSSSGLVLSDTVKKVIWCRLASHPGLQFVISGSFVERLEVLQRAVDELEMIGLSVVAEEHMRDSFMGLYDLNKAPRFEISQIQRRVLERLALSRSVGITQNELAKEFDIKGSNFFYVVRNLESQQLIVRQSTMVREKESINLKTGPKADHIVNTNLLRLSRFAKDVNLNPQQRIEISRSVRPEMLDESGNTEPSTSPIEGSEDCFKEDVHINDYMPAMKAICEKLQAAKNKVDIVSGIKSSLGYKKTTGHRAWRSILYRLKHFGLVEEFRADINGKDVSCLRLLKTFDPTYFQQKPFTHRYNNDTSSENLVKCGKRGQITDQFVEVPLEHRIYDMIDAAGQNGITILENEKFLLKVELHKWLEDIEKDKPTTMDRKTLGRSLKRLQDAGFCECIGVYMPSLTNFNNLRYAEVILHPSVNPSQELVQCIYERHRSFDIQCRRNSGSAKLKCEHPVTELPELTNVKRASPHVDDVPALKSMSANGFVLAKMVRTKLLHKFLWSYQSSSPYWHNFLSTSQRPGYNDLNLENSCQLFSIDAVIKEMPLELFLQVAGSRLIINNLKTRCKLGLRLSDLPVQEQKCLLDTQATTRLSSIVEILHRLKLIKLMSKRAVQDVNLLSYAMELHPYLEEPVPAVLPSSEINKSDVCYKLRHDFILSDKEAVDRYWETLEYCFADADPAYSRQCFPGSTVDEVFRRRSWASVRVMSTEQRMELFKRVTISDQTKKISLCECVKISRELNLTLEQVLRVSYDKRQSRLSDCNYSKSERWGQIENTKIIGAFSKKRRRLSADESCNSPQTLPGAVELIGATERTLSDIDEQVLHFDTYPCGGENTGHVQSCSTGERSVAVVHPQLHKEEAQTAAFISQCAFRELKPICKGRFSWTDNSDRKLVMQYARHRAMLGARFVRVEWPSLCDLPAHPDACKRRMATLNRKPGIRRAVLRLCGLLGDRYTSYLDSSRIKANQEPLEVDSELSYKDHETVQNQPTFILSIYKSNSHNYSWDDFEDSNIKVALNEVLKYKRLAKMDDAKRPVHKRQQGSSAIYLNCSSHESEKHSSLSRIGGVFHNDDKRGPDSSANSCTTARNRSNNNSSHRKFLKFRGKCRISQICESLPTANAIELLKLIFLSCSKTPGVQNSLARTLQKYHHGDIFAAFRYLREKEYLVIGHGSRPFVLSRKFFHDISSSPFPKDSGKRATKLSDWLQKHQDDLMHDGMAFDSDLHCGEIFHLSSLVLSGEVSVSPSVPYIDIDVADEFESSKETSSLRDIHDIYTSKCSKRKVDVPCSTEEGKKPKLLAKADGDRKEKGFPEIKLCLKMESISGAGSSECLGDGNIHSRALEGELTSVKDAYCLASLLDNVAVPYDIDSLSCWDAMTRYFELLSSASTIKGETSPSLAVLKSVHAVINRGGEQGLSMDGICGALKIQGDIAEMYVDTLESFRLAVKVNAFDSIRVVDALFISKYFISVLGHERVQNQGYDMQSCAKPQGLSSEPLDVTSLHQPNMTNKIDETSEVYAEGQILGEDTIIMEESKNGNSFHQVNGNNSSRDLVTGMPGAFRAILPWINGDGNINMNVYRGLTRRIIGIVMQNPCILEEDIIAKMDAINPQSCRRLLETMLLDNHIKIRCMHEAPVASPPSILQKLFPSNMRRPALKLQKHYFANPMSTTML